MQTVRSRDRIKVITAQTSTFQATTGTGAAAPIEELTGEADPAISSFGGEELSRSERPELTSARIIISGGRAMQSRGKLHQIYRTGCRQAGRGRRCIARRGRMRVMLPTTGRSVKPGRWSRPSSTLQSEFPARSNILPE